MAGIQRGFTPAGIWGMGEGQGEGDKFAFQLTPFQALYIIKNVFGRLAQRLERLLHTQEVTGSNPVLPMPKWRNGRRATFRA